VRLAEVFAGQPPALLIGFVAVLGTLVGSFLNVVILRLPRMMEAEWKRECRIALELSPEPETPRLSLAYPPSQCPACGASIRAWQNIPILSWLWQRGRCAACKSPISLQYPLVEAASGFLSALCAAHFGPSLMLPASLVFTWILLALAVIDLNTQLLPDDLTLPLLWLGLLLSLCGIFATPAAAIIGAAAGYLSLWTVYHVFRLLTGKEGMGYGDFKLLAALGAWMGWVALPGIILLSSLVGALVGITLIIVRRQDRSVPIPFGPYLAAAGWIMLLWGDVLRQSYWHLSGIQG
jgi:leader peptidase (prepilin peptidase)/N-methyltransferase